MKKFVLILFACYLGTDAFSQTDTTEQVENIIIETTLSKDSLDWKTYLQKKLQVNVGSENKAPLGVYKVVVRFICSKDGSISDVVAETKHGYGMEAELIRAVKLFRRSAWIPAKQNERISQTYHKITVNFVVKTSGIHIYQENTFSKNVSNFFHLSIDGVSNHQLKFTSSNGIITHANTDKYVINPTSSGKLIIDVYRKKKKARKKLTSLYFEVL